MNLPGVAAVLAPFLMIVGIVWVISRAKLEEKRLSLTSDQSADEATQYSARMAEMEERLQVLERIVTDRGYDVATQIEALRDKRRVEGQLEDRIGAL
ncbi:hypothetical protein GRI89_03085 [Altererythrobacter salegens]|uniref:Phage shock protein B n=1 Tax=Croceibacterium salegens TaxID=1737568 RepID=A0A6I4STZ4_9SPHN|nr:hypothetical protein [Croceibacterium salegens]MXO58527.1 hypothetical protein [Croceibacterium salegens]